MERLWQIYTACTLGLMLACLPVEASADAAYLEVAGANESSSPLLVMAGKKAELILTLTSAEVVEPQLSAGLALVGGVIAAPVLNGAALELTRVGSAKNGIQRFTFNVDIPTVVRRSDLVLRLRVRTDPAKGWLPMPVVMLEATPRAWQRSLRQFAKNVPSGRLGGGERLARLFQLAELEVPEIPPDGIVEDPSVRVWFAEAGTDELPLPETAPATVWIVFKKGLRSGIELGRTGSQGSFCVLVDDHALASAEDSASAQSLLERALAFARTLASSDPALSSP